MSDTDGRGTSTPTQLAIVGAGAAGAGVAYALRDAAVDVTVFEKSRGVCGRAATRRRDGCRYDHGANYVKDDDPEIAALIRDLGPDGLVDIDEPIYVFDADGGISEGRDADDHKWTWEAGITQLAKRLFARTDATVQKQTRVESLTRVDDADGETSATVGWRLTDDEGVDLGGYDAVVLTPPAPQTATLLAATEWATPVCETLERAARDVPFRTTTTAVLHYPFELERPWYALVNVDKAHDVGWVAREACKDGHVPPGESLLIAQMAPDWSARRYDDPPEAQTADAATLVADLLDDDRLASPDWTDWQGWRYAQPDAAFTATEARREAETAGLYLAGDWLAGEGRVHLALREGLDVGARIAAD